MSKSQEIKPEEKVNIVRKCQAGAISVSAASLEAGVDPKTLRAWIARYEAEGAGVFCHGGKTEYIRRR